MNRKAPDGRIESLFEGLPAFLTTDQVAELLATNKATVAGWIRTRRIPAYKVGQWRILRDDLRDWLYGQSNSVLDPEADDPDEADDTSH